MSNRGERFDFSETTRQWRRGVIGVGAWYGHTVGERLEALEQLKQGFDQVYAELGNKIGVLPYEGSGERVKKHPEWYLWWQAVAVPVFDRWATFYASQIPAGWTGPAASYIAYGERAKTDWDEYKRWLEALEIMRASAKKVGMAIVSPPPAPLATTPVEDVENVIKRAAQKAADAGHDVWTWAKVAAYGALGLGAAFATVEIVKAARSK